MYNIEVDPQLIYTLADGVFDEVYTLKAVNVISKYLGEATLDNIIVLTVDNSSDPHSFQLFEKEFRTKKDLSIEDEDMMYTTLHGGVCDGLKAVQELSEGVSGIFITKEDYKKYLNGVIESSRRVYSSKRLSKYFLR